jgi:phage nucleotide-binding protein
MKFSHSRVESFNSCPYKYKLHYLDDLHTLPNNNADNALYMGTALHTGLEKNVNEAIKQFYSFFPIVTDQIETEALKLELMIPKAKELIPDGFNEVKIEDEDFIGFIDLLAPVTGFHESEVPNVYDIYDFKYSNNIEHYKESKQLHLYKYFFEKNNPGKKIRNLYFLFAPKITFKQKKTESLEQYRQRIREEARKVEPALVEIEYDHTKVIEWLTDCKHALECQDFKRKHGWLCRFCEYEGYCMKGDTYMLLPKNERTQVTQKTKRKMWIYGKPFSGKTYLVNQFPNLLLLSTDGNYTQLPGGIPPHIDIKDVTTTEGRRTITTMGWDVFKDVIKELEKKDNDFETIVVDLAEDVYEMCRLWIYKEMGITHESDDSFRAWDKVTTQYLSTMRSFFNLDYENLIIISHEDTSRDITKRGGDKITAIKPNLREKVADKLAGMVDIVARTIAEDDVYTLNFKRSEVVFGGGRLTVNESAIPTSYENLISLYDEAEANLTGDRTAEPVKEEAPKKRTRKTAKKAEPQEEVTETVVEETPDQEPVEVVEAEVVEEEKPTRTRRTRRTRKER